jgi:AraC-like DNA-binding protein
MAFPRQPVASDGNAFREPPGVASATIVCVAGDNSAERRVSSQTLREWLPQPALAPFVSCVWIQRVEAGSDSYLHRTAPDGSVELVCQAGQPLKVVGPQTEPRAELLPVGARVVGLRFRPGAAPAVLGLPASELAALTVDADELWGAPARAIGERVAGSTSVQAVVSALETGVVSRLAQARQPDRLVAELVRRVYAGSADSIAALASSLYVSERQLRRRCEAAIGLGPKELQRIVRFQRFLALAERHSDPSATLAALALEAGYADQSHLSRESVRLAGSPPRELLLAAAEHCHGVHDHAVSHRQLLHPRV